VIGDPLADGAVNVIVASSSPAAATTFVGADGFAIGVIELEATDAAEVPATEFRATAVNVYATPGVKPSTRQLVSGANTVQVNPPGEEVIV
jgi:hypothetical protein